MDYESFKEKFVEDLKDRLDEQGADVNVSVHTVKKWLPNDVKFSLTFASYRTAGGSCVQNREIEDGGIRL